MYAIIVREYLSLSKSVECLASGSVQFISPRKLTKSSYAKIPSEEVSVSHEV